MENEDAQITKDGTEIYVGRQILNKNIMQFLLLVHV